MFRIVLLRFFNLRIKILFYGSILVFICFCLMMMVLNNFTFTKRNPHINELPVITWWTASLTSNDRLITCYNNKYVCIITNNRTKHINNGVYMFYGSEINNNDFPSQTIPWAVFHEESPKNYAPFLYENVQNLFNISSTFSRYSDFPVTLQYLEKLELITDTKYFVTIEEKNLYLNSTAPVLYIQSDCDTPVDRDFIVKTLGNFIKIDSFGVCLQNKTFPKELSNIHNLDLYNEQFLHFIARYKFIIAIENAICDDYITEKLWRPLIVGSIPIYLGSPTIQNWLPNKNSAILVQNYDSIQKLAETILQINSNDDLYNSYVEHKIFKRIQNKFLKDQMNLGPYGLETDQEYPISAFECFVCRKLYKNDERIKKRTKSIYNCPNPNVFNWTRKGNTWDQHWKVGKCQAKAINFFQNNGKPYTAEQFKIKWEFYLKNNDC